jgi:carbonic anhydrase/acetyltransferase-like protein (isoleucine patch superfamily)
MIRSYQGKTPRIHPTCFISEFAYVIGDVEIGEGSSVWPGTVIRGDRGKITIGRYTNIQDNCTVHSDADAWIGDNVTLGHGVVCHATRIGNFCLIGNNATLNDPSEIGDYCVIAANSVVLEGSKIPPRSFVAGIPAQVRGQVNERHLELMRRAAENYARHAQEYKREGLGDPIPTSSQEPPSP